MSVHKDIEELLKAEIITQEIAEKILNYYNKKGSTSPNRLFVVFGIFGAILVGLGIILILAHNWDELTRGTKVFFAFLPLLAGQVLSGFTLLKRQSSTAWRESSSAFLFFAVGASIALVSQIYNIPGNAGSFMLTWMLLCIPLVYLMKSSITSLLYISGITYYAVHVGYWSHPSEGFNLFWFLLFALLPHYYNLYKKKPDSNFLNFHHWLVPLSVIISLGTVTERTGELMFISYLSLFGLYYLIGDLYFFKQQKIINNGYKILGTLGTISLLLALSFNWFWDDLISKDLTLNELFEASEFYVSLIISIAAGIMLFLQHKGKALSAFNPFSYVFILFIIVFFIGLLSPIAVVLINILVFAIGILIINDGVKQDNLGLLNAGLLVIVALVACRFFDSNISFVIRGLLFVSVGFGFFAANYLIIKKRKRNE